MDNKEFFELQQGDKLEMEFEFQLGDETIHAGAWLVASSQACTVNFHPINDERLRLVRSSSIEWLERYMLKKAEECGGKLTTEQIEDYFKKQRFVNRLHDGNN
jgi:hypothetical protein